MIHRFRSENICHLYILFSPLMLFRKSFINHVFQYNYHVYLSIFICLAFFVLSMHLHVFSQVTLYGWYRNLLIIKA